MRVFKFGGASQKDASGIRHVANLLAAVPRPLVVVISAIGKTTNALEEVAHLAFRKADPTPPLLRIKAEHTAIVHDLFPHPQPTVQKLTAFFDQIDRNLHWPDEDMLYDQIVCVGELLASTILSDYLALQQLPVLWKDARQVICTDSRYREGRIRWDVTQERLAPWKGEAQDAILVTQGFIGANEQGHGTTLGREGSDFTAAIIASCLAADSVTIWKDVPGVMNADPRKIATAIVFDQLPYQEAAEMTYFGASVIHPKTIKPLANAGIPLYVKSFVDPGLPGTVIHDCKVRNLPPLIVFKENQCLISCKVTDYTFISEENLRLIFMALAERDIKINVMQNSAISFSFCVDFRENRIMRLIDRLSESFEVYYNTGLTLITIKNYDEAIAQQYRQTKNILMEQASRSTLQLLVRPTPL